MSAVVVNLRTPKSIGVVHIRTQTWTRIMRYEGPACGLKAFVQAHVDERLVNKIGLKAIDA